MVVIQIAIQYERLDYCSKEWRKVLFDLPLELAYRIFQMAIQKHMISWKNEHKYLMWSNPTKVVTITTNYGIEIEKLKKKYEKSDDILRISDIQKKKLYISCFGVIRSLGIQMRQFIKQNRDTEENCIKVPQKFTCKLCKPINMYTKNFTYLRNETVDIFTIDSIPNDIYDFLKSENRVVYEKGELISKYWVENKCRCFTCDLVRYTFRNYTMKDILPSRVWSKNKRIYVTSKYMKLSYGEYISSYDWYKTYDNLIVDLENKQWKRIY